MTTFVYYMMSEGSKTEKVRFGMKPEPYEVDEYFESACGGVYKWWF